MIVVAFACCFVVVVRLLFFLAWLMLCLFYWLLLVFCLRFVACLLANVAVVRRCVVVASAGVADCLMLFVGFHYLYGFGDMFNVRDLFR